MRKVHKIISLLNQLENNDDINYDVANGRNAAWAILAKLKQQKPKDKTP